MLDIDNVEIIAGKRTKSGPVLMVQFTADMKFFIIDTKGVLIAGNKDRVTRFSYQWVLCRDMAEIYPKAAWRLMDFAVSHRYLSF
jgi:import inner membrane translocase subunit TIM44